MPRYVARPRAGLIDDTDEYFGPAATAETIILSEDEPFDTGLLNADGVPLWRFPDRRPIGFDLT